MKIALTMGVLRVPPTYFAVDHAGFLRDIHDFQGFALAAEITDERLGVAVQDFFPLRNLPFGTRIRLAPLALLAMTRKLQEFQPELIHQHFATWSTPAVVASKALSAPLLTTIHGYDAFLPLRRPTTALDYWHRRNIRLAQGQSRRVLAVSEYLAGIAVTAGFQSSRLEVHYQGVDTSFFTPSVNADKGREPPIVVFVGAISRQKGVRDLIQASRSVFEREEHRLVIIGSGELRSDLEAETTKDHHIEFLGSLDRQGVRDWLRRANLLVLPTRKEGGRREAAGLVLLEAQSCGTPVVAYDSGGTGEMIDVGSSGLLAEECNVESLSNAIAAVLGQSSAAYSAMRTRAREFVVSSRSLSVSAAELDAHYRSLVA